MKKDKIDENVLSTYMYKYIEKLGYFNCLVVGDGNEQAAWHLGLRIAELMEKYFNENQKKAGEIIIKSDTAGIIQNTVSMGSNDNLFVDLMIQKISTIKEGITFALRDKNLLLIAKDNFEGIEFYKKNIDHVFKLTRVNKNIYNVTLKSPNYKKKDVNFNQPSERFVGLYHKYRQSFLTS